MEFALGRSGHGDGGESNGREDDQSRHLKEETVEETTERSTAKTSVITASTKREVVDELESTKAQMGAVRQENQRLKMSLDRIMKDYQRLEMQFQQIVKQEPDKSADDKGNHRNRQELAEESELVFLTLGRVPTNPKSEQQTKVSKQLRNEELKEELALGLECKFETSKSGGITSEALPNAVSPTNSSDDAPKEEAGETWPPSKALKTVGDSREDEVSQQNPAKKARVCVRARCDTPTMNDGCQWRKYGQKIAKGNPCPRAYYRCTVAPSCPVRKQVQRCAEDMSILITTYEGNHNHALPLSATAMASTTSAAASMLLSGSSTSRPGPGGPIASTSTTAATDLHGLNFYLSDGSKPRQFYLSNPALSSSPSHPTITIDLTNPASSSQFGRFMTSNYNPPRYSSSTSLNFCPSESNAISWGKGFLRYNSQPYNNNRNVLSNINLGNGRQLPMENIYQSYMQKNNNTNPSQHPPPETIAAATKAITADPTFQSALASALSSIIGTGNGGNQGINQGVAENLAQKMLFPTSSSTAALSLATTTNSKVNGCASSAMNKTSTNAVQTGSLMFLPRLSLPFSSPKSSSASPGDNRENTN